MLLGTTISQHLQGTPRRVDSNMGSTRHQLEKRPTGINIESLIRFALRSISTDFLRNAPGSSSWQQRKIVQKSVPTQRPMALFNPIQSNDRATRLVYMLVAKREPIQTHWPITLFCASPLCATTAGSNGI